MTSELDTIDPSKLQGMLDMLHCLPSPPLRWEPDTDAPDLRADPRLLAERTKALDALTQAATNALSGSFLQSLGSADHDPLDCTVQSGLPEFWRHLLQMAKEDSDAKRSSDLVDTLSASLALLTQEEAELGQAMPAASRRRKEITERCLAGLGHPVGPAGPTCVVVSDVLTERSGGRRDRRRRRSGGRSKK